MTKVNRYTRAGQDGKWIVCPKCSHPSLVFHFSWFALTCVSCKESIDKLDWDLDG